MFNLLHSSTNQQLVEKNSAVKVTAMKIMDDFCYERKPAHITKKSILFVVSKDKL